MTDQTRTAARLGTSLMVLLWLVTLTALMALGLEIFLKVKDNAGSAAQIAKPRYEALRRAYKPFTIQYINPYYLFFFPFDPAKRAAINNTVCHINPEGFRGPGPETQPRGNLRSSWVALRRLGTSPAQILRPLPAT
jgi:hypothetical protein